MSKKNTNRAEQEVDLSIAKDTRNLDEARIAKIGQQNYVLQGFTSVGMIIINTPHP